MELSLEQEKEILDTLTNNPDGLNMDQIYDKTSEFPEKSDLAKTLHKLTQLMTIFKKGNLYFVIEQTGDTSIPKKETIIAKSPAKVKNIPPADKKVIMQDKVSTPNPAYKPTKPNGELNRTKVSGLIAMVIYKYRDPKIPSLSLADLEIISGVDKKQLYNSLDYLTSKDYVTKVRVAGKVYHKWSDKYKYPFPSYDSRDDNYTMLSVKDWVYKYHPMLARDILPNEPIDGDAISKVTSTIVTTETMSSKQIKLPVPDTGISMLELVEMLIANNRRHAEELESLRLRLSQ